METLILKGKPVALKIKEQLSEKISKLRLKDIVPSLAAIIVGDNPASKLYVNSKAKTFATLGDVVEFGDTVSGTYGKYGGGGTSNGHGGL